MKVSQAIELLQKCDPDLDLVALETKKHSDNAPVMDVLSIEETELDNEETVCEMCINTNPDTVEIKFDRYPDIFPPESDTAEYICVSKYNEIFVCKWDGDNFYPANLDGSDIMGFNSDKIICFAETTGIYQAYYKQIHGKKK